MRSYKKQTYRSRKNLKKHFLAENFSKVRNKNTFEMKTTEILIRETKKLFLSCFSCRARIWANKVSHFGQFV